MIAVTDRLRRPCQLWFHMVMWLSSLKVIWSPMHQRSIEAFVINRKIFFLNIEYSFLIYGESLDTVCSNGRW